MEQSPQCPISKMPNPSFDEDEINLLDLFLVLLKRKRLIVGIVFLAGVAAVVISLQLINIYRSEATITPRQEEQSSSSSALSALGGLGGMVAGPLGLGGGGSLERLQVVLKSRNLAQRVIEKYELMPVFFPDVWDPKAKKWTADPPPTMQDGIKLIKNIMGVNADTKTQAINVAFDHKDPGTAKKIVDYILVETSEILREEVLRDAAGNRRFLTEQLNSITDALLREKIYAALAKEIEKDTFARAQKFYSFQVLDPPIVPDLNKKVKPKRSLICILSVVVAFFVAVFLAFFLEYLSRLKTDDSERYSQLKQALRLRKKKSP